MALSQRVSPSPCIRGKLISSVTNIFSGNWREDLQYTNISDIKPKYNPYITHIIPNLYSITHIFQTFLQISETSPCRSLTLAQALCRLMPGSFMIVPWLMSGDCLGVRAPLGKWVKKSQLCRLMEYPHYILNGIIFYIIYIYIYYIYNIIYMGYVWIINHGSNSWDAHPSGACGCSRVFSTNWHHVNPAIITFRLVNGWKEPL